MKKILIVENDKNLTHILGKLISSLGYSFLTALSLTQAYEFLESHRPDLIILDRLLPDGDGIELAQYTNDVLFTTRVLCISTLGGEKDRITGLESGIDDYLPKPFSFKELEIKITKLLFTEKLRKNQWFQVGPMRLYPETGIVLLEKSAVQLRKKEAALLSCLCLHKNQVLSRQRIIDYVWQGTDEVPTESTLDVYIRRIRAKLGSLAPLIKTTRGFGYSVSEF